MELLPHFTLTELRDWDHLRHSLATGSGIKRNWRAPINIQSAPRISEPGLRTIEEERADIDDGDTIVLARRVHRATGRLIRQWTFPDIPASLFETDMAAFRRVQRQRQVIEDTVRRRVFPGWRPDPIDMPNRFRPFDPRPAFESCITANNQFGLCYIGR